jgi:GntR family transcriptional regulator
MRNPNEDLVPLYRRVSQALATEISKKQLSPGTAIESEQSLCERFNVSRITVRKALDELVALGLVVRRRGVGTFVQEQSLANWSITLTGVIEDVITPVHLDISSDGLRPLPDDLARLADLATTTKMQCFEGTNLIKPETPLLHVAFYFPPPIAAQLSADALRGSVQAIKLVQELTGAKISHATQTLDAKNATPHIAKALRIPVGQAVLRVIRVYYDIDHKPVELLEGFYHPVNYQFNARLLPQN